MTRSGMMAAVLALLVTLIIGTSTHADNSDVPLKDRVSDLERQVRQLTDALKARDLESKFTKTDLDVLYARLERIEKALDKLQSDPSARRAFSIDPNPRTRTGTIRLRNDMAVPAAVTIDGERFTVRPFGTRVLREQPVGRISYRIAAEGMGSGSLVNSRVNANETLTIRIYDPRDEE